MITYAMPAAKQLVRLSWPIQNGKWGHIQTPKGFASTAFDIPFSLGRIAPFETRSLPALTRSYPRRFAFYVADPIRSIETRSLPALTHVLPPI
jgi:hypothetical protein